jgi:hypothetical protein
MKARLVLCFSLVLALTYFMPGLVSADSFNPNRIIDDPIFDNSNSMSPVQIDAFLNTFPNSCISANSGFRAIDPTGYSPTTGYQYGAHVTAGQVIYDAAQAYELNPQVLITTLQKEQSLVVGGAGYCNNGDEHKYAAAVGYGCPDGGAVYSYTGVDLYQRNGVTVTSVGATCVNSASKAGFTQQVIRAAWLLKFGEQRSKGNTGWAVIKGNWNNSDDPQTCYGGPMTEGTFARCPSGGSAYYDGYSTIDATSVHMDTGATAALYWYTPHFHGNQNFYANFVSWFGSAYYNDTTNPHPDGTLVSLNGSVYLVQGGARHHIAGPVFQSYSYRWQDIKPETVGDQNLPETWAITTMAAGSLFRAPGTGVYVSVLENSTWVKKLVSYASFLSLGYDWNQVQLLATSDMPAATSSTVLTNSVHPDGSLVKTNDGKVYHIDNGTLRYVTAAVFATHRWSWNAITLATSSDLSLPKGADELYQAGSILNGGGNLYVVSLPASGPAVKNPIGPWHCYADVYKYTLSDFFVVQPADLPATTGALITC